MKSALFAAALTLLAFTHTAQAQDLKSLVGDCTYVTLNNALLVAATTQGSPAIQISPLSQEVKSGMDKKQIVVLDFTFADGSTKRVGLESNLNDPESGSCNLTAGPTAMAADALAKLEVKPDLDQAPSGTWKAYMGDCKLAAINLLLKEAHAAGLKALRIGAHSSVSTVSKGQKLYDIFVTNDNNDLNKPTLKNPSVSTSQLGVPQTGDKKIQLKTVKSAGSCAASK